MLLRPKVIIADEPVSMVDASLRATILEAIYKLHREFGVSVLYITHDLTTAYHIGRRIMVLYRGSVMEAGEVASLVESPLHPYTRLLIDSVPWPDPQRRWGQGQPAASAGEPAPGSDRGCKFAARCPFVMPKCHLVPPPLFQISGTPEGPPAEPPAGADGQIMAGQPGQTDRVVACYLQEQSPALTRDALPDLLARI